jgi:hypothetical protein
MNILDVQDKLKNFSEQQLLQEMQMPSGNAPQFLVLSEMTRRKRMRDSMASQGNSGTTVAEEVVASAGVPQGGIASMAQAMAPKSSIAQNTGVSPMQEMPQEMSQEPVMGMYGGGYVQKMAEGGIVVRNGRQYIELPNGQFQDLQSGKTVSALPPVAYDEPSRMIGRWELGGPGPYAMTTVEDAVRSADRFGLPERTLDKVLATSVYPESYTPDSYGAFMPPGKSAAELYQEELIRGAQSMDDTGPYAYLFDTPVDLDLTGANPSYSEEGPDRFNAYPVPPAGPGRESLIPPPPVGPDTMLGWPTGDLPLPSDLGMIDRMRSGMTQGPASWYRNDETADQLAAVDQREWEILTEGMTEAEKVALATEGFRTGVSGAAGDAARALDRSVLGGLTAFGNSALAGGAGLLGYGASAVGATDVGQSLLDFAYGRGAATDSYLEEGLFPDSPEGKARDAEGRLSLDPENPRLRAEAAAARTAADAAAAAGVAAEAAPPRETVESPFGFGLPAAPVKGRGDLTLGVPGVTAADLFRPEGAGAGPSLGITAADTAPPPAVSPVVDIIGGGPGGPGGGGGGGGASASAAPMSSYEQELVNAMQRAEKRAQQDKWLALAQVGLGLMSSTQPTLGGAIGEAGMQGLGSFREARDNYEQERLGLTKALYELQGQQAAALASQRRAGAKATTPSQYLAELKTYRDSLYETVYDPVEMKEVTRLKPGVKEETVAQIDRLSEDTVLRQIAPLM